MFQLLQRMASENHVESEAEDSRCAYAFPSNNMRQSCWVSYDGNDVPLGRSHDLYVRCQLQPRSDSKIVEHLKPILISQKLPGYTEKTCKLGVIDINVVKADPEAVKRPTRDDSLTADSKAVEEMHGVRIAIRNPKPPKDTDTLV